MKTTAKLFVNLKTLRWWNSRSSSTSCSHNWYWTTCHRYGLWNFGECFVWPPGAYHASFFTVIFTSTYAGYTSTF
jgi:hypothetical protein